MNDKRLYAVILGPHTTEKSVRMAEENRQIVFKVARDATREDIKQAVSKLFSVEVEKVNTVRVKGKVKRFKQVEGHRKDWKKAYVSLKEGHDINLANFE